MGKRAGSQPLRRSTRVHVRVPVIISGTLADGSRFTEETYVLSISKYGARLKTQYPLSLDMQLRVQPKGSKDVGLFRVVWIGKDDTPRAGEVGVEYVQVSNLLGVAFPD